MLSGKTILVTGGTGSFGKKFVSMTLKRYDIRKLIVFSRDEMKQFEMEQLYRDKRVRFFIGDLRDKDRFKRACDGVDYIVHAAALKIVPSAEYNPFEYVKTNIIGAMNLVDSAIDCGVKKIIALSTDKACNPVNLYGATKFCAERLFVAGNSYSGMHETIFSLVRYGNVMGSRGSIIPFFREQATKGVIPITDPKMTRFWIKLEGAVELVYTAFDNAGRGDIFIPKIPSMKVVDLANVIAPGVRQEVIGIRPGEKIHESLITEDEARYAYEFKDHYRIAPSIYDPKLSKERLTAQGGRPVAEGFRYTSENNPDWLNEDRLRGLLKDV